MQILLILNLIVPFVMIIVGRSIKKHPAPDMSSQNGYNTPTSRKSEEHWRYAQSIAPDIFISLGKKALILEIVISVILFFLKIEEGISLTIGNGIGFVVLFFCFYITDSKIEEKFKDEIE